MTSVVVASNNIKIYDVSGKDIHEGLVDSKDVIENDVTSKDIADL